MSRFTYEKSLVVAADRRKPPAEIAYLTNRNTEKYFA